MTSKSRLKSPSIHLTATCGCCCPCEFCLPTTTADGGIHWIFRFRLEAASGEIIALSEAYASRVGCVSRIQSAKKNAAIVKIVEAGA